MSKTRTVHRCSECGAATPRWAGRCPACEAWNTLVEELEVVGRTKPIAGRSSPTASPRRIDEIDATEWSPRPTGIDELDRVLDGGLVPGSVTLIGGEPGIGKSTLTLQLLSAAAHAGATALLVSAEESGQQVRLRAERLGAVNAHLWLVAETSLPAIEAAISEVAPDLLVVDSIQTVFDPELESAPGSVSQVRGCAHRLVELAKSRGMATVLVGHVTKEGALAGPRVLEHVVDTVLSFEGERHHALRLLRAVKHRFGSTGELGLFEMTDGGLTGVPDPSGLFLGDRRAEGAGSVVVATMEGHRPLLVEIQALVAATDLAMPRRSAQGLDGGRLSLLLAVLDRHVNVTMAKVDVYASAVGGVRLVEPGVDLGLALALVSAKRNRPLPPSLVACGEVGLGGEVRQVAQLPRRLAEAARLGFTEAIVPASAPDGPGSLRLHRVSTLRDAVATA